MSRFTIEAPDGRRVTIEANDEATAIRGAQEWYASQGGARRSASPVARQRGGAQQPARPSGRPDGGLVGFMANVNRGTGIGDEAHAALTTLGAFIDQNAAKPTKPGLAGLIGSIADTYKQRLANERQTEDAFAAEQPFVAGLGRGTGAALTMLAPAGSVQNAAVQGGSRVMNAVRGGVAAAPSAAAYGLADRGTAQERGNAANVNMLLAGALGATGGALATKPPKPQRLPTANPEQLRVARSAAYQAADNAGVQYAPAAFDDMVTAIKKDVTSSKISATRHPKASDMVAEIEGMSGHAPTLTELDQLRQVVRRDVANPRADDAERFFGEKIISQIDDFIERAGPGDVIAGNADDAQTLIKSARDLNARYRKVEAVTDAVESAVLRAGSTGSGGNVDNAIRQNLRRVLENTRNLSDAEARALREIVMGGKGQNALRLAGKLSPSGNGLMAAGNLGAAAIAGPLGAVPGAVGIVAKTAADNMTKGKVDALIRLMGSGGKTPPTTAAGPVLPALAQARLARGAGVATGRAAGDARDASRQPR